MVVVEVDTRRGLYRDAFYYDPGKVPDERDIEAEVQKRADAWVMVVETPPKVPTGADLDEAIADATAQKAALDVRIVDLTEQKAALSKPAPK
jgi:hypothetical protein